MKVTDLIDQLMNLKNDGGGDAEVFVAVYAGGGVVDYEAIVSVEIDADADCVVTLA